jgi:dolichol-phosphate mannosyltransferase
MDTAQPALLAPSALLKCPAGPYRIPRLPAPDRRLSIVIPTLNEAENIEALLIEVCAVLDRKVPHRYEVIVVDDDSSDRTWLLAARLVRTLTAVRVIRRMGERGLASAVVRGYQAANGQILGTINADFQHPPSLLAAMIDRLNDAGLVVARRDSNRLFLSWAARFAGQTLVPKAFTKLADPLSGCYLFHRTAIEEVTLAPVGLTGSSPIYANPAKKEPVPSSLDACSGTLPYRPLVAAWTAKTPAPHRSQSPSNAHAATFAPPPPQGKTAQDSAPGSQSNR